MNHVGEEIAVKELFHNQARTQAVGAYGSKVVNHRSFASSVFVLQSAKSSAGTGVSLAVKMQESDDAIRGSKDDSAGAVDNDVKLRSAANTAIKLAAKVTQTGARQIKSVSLRLKRLGTIAAGKVATITLETDSTGNPSGTAVHEDAVANVLCTAIGTEYQWVEFAFPRAVDVADTTVFHIVLSGDYTESADNCIVLAVSDVASGGDYNIYDTTWGTLDDTKKVVGFDLEFNFSDMSGAAFSNVDETADSFQTKDLVLSDKKPNVRALATITGASASFVCSACAILGESPDAPVSD